MNKTVRNDKPGTFKAPNPLKNYCLLALTSISFFIREMLLLGPISTEKFQM